MQSSKRTTCGFLKCFPRITAYYPILLWGVGVWPAATRQHFSTKGPYVFVIGARLRASSWENMWSGWRCQPCWWSNRQRRCFCDHSSQCHPCCGKNSNIFGRRKQKSHRRIWWYVCSLLLCVRWFLYGSYDGKSPFFQAPFGKETMFGTHFSKHRVPSNWIQGFVCLIIL